MQRKNGGSFRWYRPESWGIFEEMSLLLFQNLFDNRQVVGHARQGQSDFGIDIYGHDLTQSRKKLIGIQCKDVEQISEKEIVSEIQKAERFHPAIDEYIIVTTAKCHGPIQRKVLEISTDRKKRRKFPVSIWFWEDYEAKLLNIFPEIAHSFLSPNFKVDVKTVSRTHLQARRVYCTYEPTTSNRLSIADLCARIRSRWPRLRAMTVADVNASRTNLDIISTSSLVVAIANTDEVAPMMEAAQARALGKECILLVGDGIRVPGTLNGCTILRVGTVPTEDDICEVLDQIEKLLFEPRRRMRAPENRKIMATKLRSGSTLSVRSSEDGLSDIADFTPLELADHAFANGDFVSSAKYLEPLVDAGQADERVLHSLADTYLFQAESQANNLSVLNYAKKMLRISEIGLENFPSSFLLQKDKGVALLCLGRLNEARDLFKMLASQQLNTAQRALVYYDLACTASLQRDVITTNSYLRLAIDLDDEYQEFAKMDPDFDNVWEDAVFQALVFRHRGGDAASPQINPL